MKKIIVLLSFMFVSLDVSCNEHTKTQYSKPDENTKIQVALLLDTSNSMDGLIEQAKSRLWNIVNTLTTLKYKGKLPTIEISLYEYGNDGLSSEKNYIRQVTPLTTDLDLISEKLFSLRTNGGAEYCGAVIQDAKKNLKWATGNSTMKLLYIAGNEGFNQGPINYKEAINDALKNDIYINTIYCGNQNEGINLLWKDGADVAKGKYFNIDSNQTIQYFATPYDDSINQYNIKINATYIGYGRQGYMKKNNQEVQDKNAESISSANFTERTLSKASSVYTNSEWDLVDKYKDDKTVISKIKKEELPKELANKSTKEIEEFINEKTKEREKLQKEIAELAKKRQEFIDKERDKTVIKDDLGVAISNSIIEFGKIKGFTNETKK